MNAGSVGTIIAALFGSGVVTAVIAYVRDRRIPPLDAEARRIANVDAQLVIFERLNLQLERRVEHMAAELADREAAIAELKIRLAKAESDLSVLRTQLGVVTADLHQARAQLTDLGH